MNKIIIDQEMTETRRQPTNLEQWLSFGKYIFWLMYVMGYLLKIMAWRSAGEVLLFGLCGYAIYYIVFAKQLLQARTKMQTIISYTVGLAIAPTFIGNFFKIDNLPFGTELLYVGFLLSGLIVITAVIAVLMYSKNTEILRFSSIIIRTMVGVFVFSALLPVLIMTLIHFL